MELITRIAFDNSKYGIAAAMSWIYAVVVILFLSIVGLIGYRIMRSGQGGKA